MKKTLTVSLLSLMFLAGCTTTNRVPTSYVQPEWQDIKGLTKREIADYLRKKGDDVIVSIYKSAQLIDERRNLLREKEGEEAATEVKKLTSLLKAYEEQILREAEARYNYALKEAQKTK